MPGVLGAAAFLVLAVAAFLVTFAPRSLQVIFFGGIAWVVLSAHDWRLWRRIVGGMDKDPLTSHD